MFGKILSLTVNICAYEFKVYSFLYVIKYIIVNDYLCHLCGVILTLKSNGCDIQIQDMAQRLDMYLNRYLAQYINCMTSDSEFVDFVNHAFQLALDLMAYPNIWAVLPILLETQDVNTS